MFRIKNPLHARVGKHIRNLANKHWLRWSLAGIAILFVLTNAVLFVVYRNRLYPSSGVAGRQLGNKTFSYVSKQDLITNSVLVRSSYFQFIMPMDELGIKVDWPATQKYIQKHKPWLPIAGCLVIKNMMSS
jgi:hypothetical protein